MILNCGDKKRRSDECSIVTSQQDSINCSIEGKGSPLRTKVLIWQNLPIKKVYRYDVIVMVVGKVEIGD